MEQGHLPVGTISPHRRLPTEQATQKLRESEYDNGRLERENREPREPLAALERWLGVGGEQEGEGGSRSRGR